MSSQVFTKFKNKGKKRRTTAEVKNKSASSFGWDVSHIYDNDVSLEYGVAVLFRNATIKYFDTPEHKRSSHDADECS